MVTLSLVLNHSRNEKHNTWHQRKSRGKFKYLISISFLYKESKQVYFIIIFAVKGALCIYKYSPPVPPVVKRLDSKFTVKSIFLTLKTSMTTLMRTQTWTPPYPTQKMNPTRNTNPKAHSPCPPART